MRKLFGLAAGAMLGLGMALLPRPAFGTLTHEYTFNDGTANDYDGGANGTLMNGATITPDGKLYFSPTVNNGSNNPSTGQYVQLPYNIVHTPSFTIEAWATTRVAASWQRILDLGNSSGGYGEGFLMVTPYGYSGEGLFSQLSLYDSGGASDTAYVTTSTVPSTNVEHMYTVTYNLPARQMSIYMDGNFLSSVVTNPLDPSTTSYSNFWIGRSQFSGDPYFDGTIDELRTYDSALTSQQVAADYAAGPTSVPEPVSAAVMAGIGAMRLGRGRRILNAPTLT